MGTKSLLMAMAALTIAGCSQNEVTEINPDADRTIGLDVYGSTDQRNGNHYVHAERSGCRFRYFRL